MHPQTIDELNDPRMRAVLEVAKAAHANQFRRGGRDYIDHPVMVFRILDAFDCTDIQKAIGLLHDTVEDSPLFPNHLKLFEALNLQLQLHCPATADEVRAELHHWALEVCEGVQKMTNNPVMPEGKRTWQVEHMQHACKTVRAVKIADQAASVIDDIYSLDIHSKAELRRARRFALKGVDVVRASTEAATRPLAAFYHGVFHYFEEMHAYADAGDIEAFAALRRTFDSDLLVEQSHRRAHHRVLQQVRPLPVVRYSPHSERMQEGIVQVTLCGRTGSVMGFGAIVHPSEPASTANRLVVRLRDRLEEPRRMALATERLKFLPHPQELSTRVHMRYFRFNYPRPLHHFLRHAEEAGAIDADFHRELMQAYIRQRIR